MDVCIQLKAVCYKATESTENFTDMAEKYSKMVIIMLDNFTKAKCMVKAIWSIIRKVHIKGAL